MRFPGRSRHVRLVILLALVAVLFMFCCYAEASNAGKSSPKKGGKRKKSSRKRGKGVNITKEQAQAAESAFERAMKLKSMGNLVDAMTIMKQVTQIVPEENDPYFHLGLMAVQGGELQEAERAWQHAARLTRDPAPVLHNLGALMAQQGRLEEAISFLSKAASLAPSDPGPNKALGVMLAKAGKLNSSSEAFVSCIASNPAFDECWCGLGNSLVRQGIYKDAIRSYEAAARTNPSVAGYFNNIGNTLQRYERNNHTSIRKALGVMWKALQVEPTYATVYNNLASLLGDVGNPMAAWRLHRKAVELEPNNAEFKCTLFQVQRKYAIWNDFKEKSEEVKQFWLNFDFDERKRREFENTVRPVEGKRRGNDSKSDTLCPAPLDSLSNWGLGGEIVRTIASAHSRSKFELVAGEKPLPSTIHSLGGSHKLLVGWVSNEFHDRPVGRDLVNLIESLQQTSILSACFCLYSVDEKSSELQVQYRERITKACNGGFWDISSGGFQEGAKTINSVPLNVAVNLDGFTSAPHINEIFAMKPTQLSLNFKGFASTLGDDLVNGFLADRIITPPDYSSFYSEKLILMPHSYHYNGHDRLYPIDPETPQYKDRADIPELPDKSFVLCNWNQFYKFTPDVFSVYVRVMQSYPDTVMWLIRWDNHTRDAFRDYVTAYDISFDRFIFSKHYPLNEHVFFKGVCDLHLDNRPYSAHGTATDVLYTGVPHLALVDETAASRVSASLLLASGYPSGWITLNLEDYQALLMAYAHPSERWRMRSYKKALRTKVLSSAAFDSDLYSREMERALRVFWESFFFEESAMHVRVSAVRGEI